MTLRRILIILVLLIAMGALAWLLLPNDSTTPRPGGRFSAGGPMPVVAATAQKGDMKVNLAALGTVTPLATVTVQTQISGLLTQIGFQEGQMVKAGDFLAQIDPRPYQVALEQAEGALARDQASLTEARVDLARYQKLFAQDSIAEQQVDTQRATVGQDEGTVKSDQAQIDTEKLNLVYCHITAPVSGRVGLRQVDAGNYVTPSSLTNGIVVITQLQPITVVFTLPEDNVPDLMAKLHQGATLSVAAYDRARTRKLADGMLGTVDNQIDTATGTVKLKAQFANTDLQLFPNQFVNTDLLLDTLHDAILVPQAAVQRGAPGTFVYLINDGKTVSVRPVTLGASDPDKVVITKGLAAGDQVVIDGADKLKDNAPITLPAANPAAGDTPAAQHHGHGGQHRRDGTTPQDGQPAQPQQ